MAQTDIGIDLGTTTIIIAQAGQGVVLNQPSVVAVDTRKNSVLEVGDKALAMVGRTPNYISATPSPKDGVISDHTHDRSSSAASSIRCTAPHGQFSPGGLRAGGHHRH